MHSGASYGCRAVGEVRAPHRERNRDHQVVVLAVARWLLSGVPSDFRCRPDTVSVAAVIGTGALTNPDEIDLGEPV